MTTSVTQSTSAKPNDAPFSRRELAVFEGYAQNAAHNAVLEAYEKVRGTITRAFIARKLGVDPSQVTRWLSSPGNYEVKTLGYLLGAMGYVPGITPVETANLSRGNNFAHEVLDYPMPQIKATDTASTTAQKLSELKIDKPLSSATSDEPAKILVRPRRELELTA